MLNQGLGSWIHKRRVKPQDHTAIIEDGTSLSYAELAAQIDKLANVLGDLGVEKGVRVAYLGNNHSAVLQDPRVEGQWKVQDGNTRDLIFSVPWIVSDLPKW